MRLLGVAGPGWWCVVMANVRGPCMMNVSVNKAGAIFNVMSSHNGMLTASSIGARSFSGVRSCMRTIDSGLHPLVRSFNNMRGVGNVKMNTPGKGCCGKAVRFTPGLP